MIEKLHIGIVAPIGTEHIAEFLTCGGKDLPRANTNAPFTAALIAELLKQGHTISAFTTDTSLPVGSKPLKASGKHFDFYICPERRRAWRFNQFYLGRALDAFAYERKLLTETIKQAKPDIIHAHWTYEFALAAIKTGIPHLITCHDAPSVVLRFNPYPYRAIRYLMARQVFRKGKCFSTVSDYMISQLQHYTKQSITVVPNPLADFVLNSGKIRNKPSSKRIALICNGWDDRKNPKPALQAFAKIFNAEPTSELHLYGHGFGVGEAAEKWCKQQNIVAGLFFHGPTPHKELIKQLNEFDLLLHPSLEESFGVVLGEAMALGLPIAAGRYSGAVPWVVGFSESEKDLCCAVLTDVSDPHAIFVAINQVFDNHYPERSAAGYHRARELFSAKVITESYKQLYYKIIHT